MGKVVNVESFGATPNSREDATAAVSKAVQSLRPGDTLSFPQGEFHFYAQSAFHRELYLSNTDVTNPRNVAISLEKLRDIRVEGSAKTRLVFHGRVMPFLIDGSSNISLKNLEIDWERPLMSQAEVLTSDANGLTLKIDPKKYPYTVRDKKLVFLVEGEERSPWSWMEFDPKTRGVAYNTGDRGCMGGDWNHAVVSEREPGVVRLDYPTQDARPKVGDRLIARHGSRDHAGTFIQNSKNIRLENIAYRHTSGLGVLAQRSENISFRHVDFRPTAASGRLFSGHDDGFHISNCKGSVTIEECWFDGLMDDPINVHGTSIRAIKKIDGRTWQAKFMHGQSMGFTFGDPGDTVSFLSKATMESFGTAKIVKIEPTNTSELRITFDREAPAKFQDGDALENLTWTPSATIRKNVFGGVRARGLLVSTPKKVLVEDNTFRSSGSAILIPGDANGWYESGAVTDVTIRRNRFENCLTSPYQFCDAVISICPEIPQDGGPAFHRNIRIVDNVFITFQKPVLWAKSVDGLEFSGNSIEWSYAYKPWHGNDAGLTFIDCKNVTVKGNLLDTKYPGHNVVITRGRPETIKISDWK